MNRRDLLAVGAVTALAGCLGYELQETERVANRRVRLAELEATVEARETRITELEARVDELQNRLATAESDQEALERQVDGPRVNDVALVERWDRFGDVVNRATDRVTRGDLATLAVNFTTSSLGVGPETQGRQEEAAQRLTTVSVTLRADDGRVVETRERELRYFIETGRLGETPLLFDTRGLAPGEYVAEGRVRDVVAGIDSRPVTTQFAVA